MEKKKVALVILNFNGRENTLECLASVKKLKEETTTIDTIVVDNGSTDNSKPAIRSQFPEADLIENHKNLGFCLGNNIGAREAFQKGADYVLLLNNDTLVHPFLIEGMVGVARETNAGILSPKIYFAPGFEFHKDRYTPKDLGKVIWYAGGLIDWANVWPSHRGVNEVDRGQFDEACPTQFATGCALLISKEAYQSVGLYDPLYFAYFEDTDLSLRAQKKGFSVYYAPRGIVWHKNAATIGGSGSEKQDYWVTRNRMIFGLSYAPLRSKFALLRYAAKCVVAGPSQRRRAILDALTGRADIQKIRGGDFTSP